MTTCNSCKYWSEKIAGSTEDGQQTEAMCIVSKGPKTGKYRLGRHTCDKHVTGVPIDTPGRTAP